MNLLNIADFKLKDVPVQAVYGEEESKIHLGKYIVKTLYLQTKWFFAQDVEKVLLREGTLTPAGFLLSYVLYMPAYFPCHVHTVFSTGSYGYKDLAKTTALICSLAFFMGSQFQFFGMWMDMEGQ